MYLILFLHQKTLNQIWPLDRPLHPRRHSLLNVGREWTVGLSRTLESPDIVAQPIWQNHASVCCIHSSLCAGAAESRDPLAVIGLAEAVK